MGLGPPVCQHCHVVANFTDEAGWHCKYCKETKFTDNVWPNGDRWNQYKQNEKFLDFITGKDPNAPTQPRHEQVHRRRTS